MDMRKQALEEERKRREELEKRLQEETSRRQKLIEREVKLREKQRAQVRKKEFILFHPDDHFDLDVTFVPSSCMVSVKPVLTALSIASIHLLLFSCLSRQLLAAEERIFNLF